MRSLIKKLMIGSLFIGCGLFLFLYYDLSIRPLSLSSPVIRVNQSMSAHAFVSLVQQQMTWRQRMDSLALLSWIKTKGLARQLKAGIYQVSPGESVLHFLNRVIQGDVLTLSFRIGEGHTVRQISQQLKAAPYMQYQTSNWQSAIPQQNPEGLLLADTYRYIAGDNAVRLLIQAQKRLNEVLQQAWLQRDKTLPYQNAYELLIAASIIEKEAAFSDERRLIGGVVVNRLRAHMPLQMDPTVIYALGQAYQGHLSHADLSVDSPYNTYHHRGLPPTPIGMVSQDAIRAAAQPQPSHYLYFVARGDGRHTFSETYEQQREAVARYRARNAP